MGVFSFMETFFFISLGITFVMIIMLVYHFKQRIIVLERKHDTMFDIVNNIVKQIKNMQVSITYLGENQHVNFHPSKHENVVTFSNGLLPTNTHEFNIMFNDGPEIEPHKNTQEDSDGENDSSEDDDDDNEDNDEDDDDDDSADDDDDDNDSADDDDDDNDSADDDEPETKKIIVSDDDNQVESNIKVINVDIAENDTTESNDLGIVEISEIESTLLKQNMELNDEDIVIRKIENTKTEEVANDSTKDNKEIYKKMSLAVLRATAIEKGLSTDPSKLKKQELVQLLESAE